MKGGGSVLGGKRLKGGVLVDPKGRTGDRCGLERI